MLLSITLECRGKGGISIKDELIIFIHIPKTAGTTLRSILKKEYGPLMKPFYLDKEQPPDMKPLLACKKCIGGHIGYGIWMPYWNRSLLLENPCSRPVSYITMLRDPVERLISLYNFLKIIYLPIQEPASVIFNLTFEDFVESNHYQADTQTLYITGGSLDIDTAKHHLTRFRAVGITERFDESIFLMKRKFGWGDLHYQKLNITPNRPQKNQLTDSIIQRIQERNALDVELYRFAKSLLEREIKSLDSQSGEELRQFLNRPVVKSKKFIPSHRLTNRQPGL
ncbi:sulfotransferase family 2 domain-containing protein [Salinithrix halophila]|uniref:Sulfotransferase family 2 domain-containing protein n=1 Tax=Salinithrix halophila TaxID=1485204 RepID=A0ABV8JBD8_9BACL